jgi:hypothetical protein
MCWVLRRDEGNEFSSKTSGAWVSMLAFRNHDDAAIVNPTSCGEDDSARLVWNILCGIKRSLRHREDVILKIDLDKSKSEFEDAV